MILKRENVEVIENDHERIKALMDKGFCPVVGMTVNAEKKMKKDHVAETTGKAAKMAVEDELSEEALPKEAAEKTPTEQDLTALKKPELIKMAESAGIIGAKNLTKAELVEVLAKSPEEWEA